MGLSDAPFLNDPTLTPQPSSWLSPLGVLRTFVLGPVTASLCCVGLIRALSSSLTPSRPLPVGRYCFSLIWNPYLIELDRLEPNPYFTVTGSSEVVLKLSLANSRVHSVERKSRSRSRSHCSCFTPLPYSDPSLSTLQRVCVDPYFILFLLAAQMWALPSVAQLRYHTFHQLASARQVVRTMFLPIDIIERGLAIGNIYDSTHAT